MSAEALIPYTIGLLGSLIGLLCTVLAWVGVQIKGELKELGTEMKTTNKTLTAIERDLRGELAGLDRRVSLVEAKCQVVHGNNGHDD